MLDLLMTDGNLDSNKPSIASSPRTTNYDVGNHLADFILGITFEIWEQGQVDNILDYYSEDVEVYSLDGITHGAKTMVDNTHATLASYPDRLLVADDVIYSGTTSKGYSSHRLLSPMTNTGPSSFGPATGRILRIMNIADCEINDGLITREWLVRDNLALVTQLGIDPLDAARTMADSFDSTLKNWLRNEYDRTRRAEHRLHQNDPVAALAQQVLSSLWVSGNQSILESAYAPYCVMHRSPIQLLSGRSQILDHYANWRRVFPSARLTIDHVCSQPEGVLSKEKTQNVAIRWSLAGTHEGSFSGSKPDSQPIYITGVTHWKLMAGRIVTEWTVFDELGMLAQTLN